MRVKHCPFFVFPTADIILLCTEYHPAGSLICGGGADEVWGGGAGAQHYYEDAPVSSLSRGRRSMPPKRARLEGRGRM